MIFKHAHKRAGFTVIELMIAMVLIGLVLAKLTMVMTDARKAYRRESASMALEDQAAQVLDRIAFTIIGSDADTIDPGVEAPFSTDELSFRISMGVEEGVVVWGDPEQIGLRGDGSQLYWGQNVGAVEERIVVWCNTVSEMLEGELLNGFDDNGNSLNDEMGLSFDKDGKSITIRMTLTKVDNDGKIHEVTAQTTVTCRN